MKPVADTLPTQLLAGHSQNSSSSGESGDAEAFWSAAQLRITVSDGRQSRTHLVCRPVALFGCHPQCDVVLPESAVPKRCYCVLATDRGLYGASLLPRSVRERRGFRRVTPGRSIRIGRYRLQMDLVSGSNGHEISASSEPHVGAADWGLEWVENGVRRYAHLRCQRPLLVGRRDPSQIVINDPTMSVVHCLVYPQHGQLWVVDLCSSNGTWVRRSRAPVQKLAEGRSFKAGATRFRWLPLKERAFQSVTRNDSETTSSADVSPALFSRDGRTTSAEVIFEPFLSANLMEAAAARENALHDELNGLKMELSSLHTELQTLRTEHDRVCQDAGDLSQRRAVLERDEMAWRAWYESEEARLTHWAAELQAQEEQAARERETWYRQRAAEVDRWEELTRDRTAQHEAWRDSFKQQQDNWESEHRQQVGQLAAEQRQSEDERAQLAAEQRQSEDERAQLATEQRQLEDKRAQLATEQQQLEDERAQLATAKAALEQSTQKQREDQQQVETIAYIKGELTKMKARLATMQREREQWLVQRIRTQRALNVREQNTVAQQQRLDQRQTQLSAWEAQLRKQQQDLTDQRRRDLELALPPSSAGSPTLDALSECARRNVGINGRLPSPENCLSAPNFFELLDRALREKDRSG